MKTYNYHCWLIGAIDYTVLTCNFLKQRAFYHITLCYGFRNFLFYFTHWRTKGKNPETCKDLDNELHPKFRKYIRQYRMIHSFVCKWINFSLFRFGSRPEIVMNISSASHRPSKKVRTWVHYLCFYGKIYLIFVNPFS